MHSSPNHGVLKQTYVGPIEFMSFFALTVVKRDFARTIHRNQILLGFAVGVLPARNIGLGTVNVKNPFDLKRDVDTSL